ncbi:MAG: hypothetical protein QOJ60_93, partial [Actinomycetota bacterium]|nr:hypothetical protein [Actinomycetota bacterium]
MHIDVPSMSRTAKIVAGALALTTTLSLAGSAMALASSGP